MNILRDCAELLRPPRRIPVADTAARSLRIYRPGAGSAAWNPRLTPYLVEPMNRLADRRIDTVVFVGPARTGKTLGLVLGWLTHAALNDPGDMLVLHMTEHTARDFSKDDLARAHRHSPDLAALVSPLAADNNVFDRTYRHGMRLSVGWPAATQLSGRTLRYVALTDYDRFPPNIDGEGDAFTLARKRVQTFGSAGKVLVESSPGFLIDDAKWKPTDPHEGPPCGGVFALYNQGDRRRWYWPCPECREYFTAAPAVEALAEVDNEICLICPCCGSAIGPQHKAAMNLAGEWRASGGRPDTAIASYWLTGPAAAYQTWASLWRKAHAALAERERTGNEEPLKATTTGDFGIAYRPRQLHVTRDPRALESRAEDVQRRTLPDGVKFLTAAVDVQKNRFVVQAIGHGRDNERWIVDRYNLKWSRRASGDGFEPIDPAGRLEDWAILIDRVLLKPYPFERDESRGLRPLMTAIDSGGKAGVTERAYLFWRQLRRAGHAARALLVKGSSRPDAPRLHKTFPDSSKRRDRKADARGEIPVWQLNTLILKDALAADLERAEPGPGYIHLPAWLGAWFFDELAAETRTHKGWENPGGARNEAFDLLVYAQAAALALRADAIDWTRPPGWADPDRQAVALTPSAAPPPAAPKPRREPKPGFINRPVGERWL